VRRGGPKKSGLEPSADSSRLRVLELLRQSPGGLGVAELAERSGLHPNTVRFHLNRFVTAGLARRDVEQQPSRPGRPRLTFVATPENLRRDQRNYQLLAAMLAGYMADTADPAMHARHLGNAWGSYLATRPVPGQRVTEEESVGDLLRVLDDIGFSPQLTQDGDGQGVIELRHCPFLEVATAHREVVCSLHLGVMQGVLAEQRAPVEASDLQPFVEPSLCLAHVRRREPAESSAS
jgi:predicted ArsR family transcriptional regulator